MKTLTINYKDLMVLKSEIYKKIRANSKESRKRLKEFKELTFEHQEEYRWGLKQIQKEISYWSNLSDVSINIFKEKDTSNLSWDFTDKNTQVDCVWGFKVILIYTQLNVIKEFFKGCREMNIELDSGYEFYKLTTNENTNIILNLFLNR